MRNLLYHIGIILLLVLDAFFGYCIVIGPAATKAGAFALHLIVSGLAVLIFSRIKLDDFRVGRNFTLVAGAVTAFMPLYGLLGMYILIFVIDRVKLPERDYFDPEEEFSVKRRQRDLLLAQRKGAFQVKREELDIRAYRDIFRSNDRELEEMAISKLSKLLNRESVALLQDVIQHATSDTKVMAANAIIDMEDRIVRKINSLRSKLGNNLNDPELMLELARIYDLYCYLGVLDEAINRYYRTLALDNYSTFLKLRPKHPEATFEYGRTLLHAGEKEKAIEYLSKAIQHNPASSSAYLWLAEAKYECHDYQAVTEICRKVDTFSDLPENFTATKELWTE